jgi:hypothetical protein
MTPSPFLPQFPDATIPIIAFVAVVVIMICVFSRRR